MTAAPAVGRSASEVWDDAAPLFAEAVRGYHTVRGRDRNLAEVERNARINSELVPQRGRLLLEALGAAGVELRGARVLDTGSGFGALAAYLALEGGPAAMVASDVRRDLLALGSACADAVGELRSVLEFVVADVRDLSQWEAASFDVVMLTGVVPYLTRSELEGALAGIRRVLAPDGVVVLYQSNRWWPVDRFSGRPLVHLLPRVRDRGRVRLRSLPELRRHLRRAGFAPRAALGFARNRRLPRPLRAVGSATALVARPRS